MAGIITALDLTKVYGKGEGAIKALDAVNFSIEKGEVTIIYGPSGAGKTTLLNLLGGMDVPTSGFLVVDGENISGYSKLKRSNYRRDKVGFVFQFYNLMSTLNATENIELATQLRGKEAKDPQQTLESVGLGKRAKNLPSQLSGGEQQRVSLARAIAKNPDLILADEPTGALDYQTGKYILSLLVKAAREEGKTVVIVTHNKAIVEIGDHLIELRNGAIFSDDHNPEPKNVEDLEW